MPRQARKESGTGIFHVMMRGINRQDIFDETVKISVGDRKIRQHLLDSYGIMDSQTCSLSTFRWEKSQK